MEFIKKIKGIVYYKNKSIFIWYGASDFIIGGYCLFSFILPFRKYIKLEQEQEQEQGMQTNTHRDSLSSIKEELLYLVQS